MTTTTKNTTMSRNAKIGIGVVAGLVVACLCICLCGVAGFAVFGGGLASQLMQTDPAQAQAAGAAMLDYSLPDGYHELAAMNVLTVKMVMIGRAETLEALQSNQDPMIIIGQAATRQMMDDPALRQQIETTIRDNFNRSMQGGNVTWEEVDSAPLTIAGQETTLTTYAGQADDGTTMRQQMTGVFEGKGGPTFIIVIGPADSWPDADMQAFFASLE